MRLHAGGDRGAVAPRGRAGDGAARRSEDPAPLSRLDPSFHAGAALARAGGALVTRLLERLRVIDITDGAFAYAPRLLAGLGAEVVRIEPSGGSAVARTPTLAMTFGADRVGRTLDLDNTKERDDFLSLVRGADVLCESFRPGHLSGLGL